MASVIGAPTAVVSVPEPARAFFVAGLASLSSARPLLVAVPTASDAERLAGDLRVWVGEDAVDVFPAWETLPFERVSPAIETMGRRLQVMWRLRSMGAAGERPLRIVVAPVKALVQRLGPHVEETAPIVVRKGDIVDSTELVERLVRMGYRRDYQVEARGDVAVRGSIVDVFPSTADAPVRIDLWGDEVDRLSEFLLTDQRSTEELDCAELFPCRELLPTDEVRARAAKLVGEQPWGRAQWERLSEGMVFDGMESWLPWLTEDEHVLTDLLADDAQVLLFEPRRMRDRAAELLDEEASLAATLAETWGAAAEDHAFPRLHVDMERLLAHTKAPVRMITTTPESPDVAVVEAGAWDPVVGDGSKVAGQITTLLDDGYSVLVAADGRATATRMASALTEHGLAPVLVEGDEVDATKPGLRVVVSHLERGFILPSAKLAVLSEADVTGRRRAHRAARPRKRVGEGFFDDLKPGDYVVHHQHGVGKYAGMVKRAIGGVERDYLMLEYKGADKLYVPSDQIDAIRPYTGGETPSLHKLGGTDFGKTKARVRQAVREIAAELVVLYQKRTHSPGHAFAPDTPWQREMEEAFPFQETVDQLKAIDEVKGDMEQSVPMDRLICGDVGFGKTEIAIRAAFKAVQDGRQVAVLVPTTLLAQQHFNNFSERFSGYPIRVEVLSRFLTPAQAKKVVAGVKAGEVDVVVGTHKLLSDKLEFKDLGLLVVDEEQRFGVQHKEAIKHLQTNVDVLTLSATPIPRTLEMSLTGIRDLTILNTPPADRQPILTYVGEKDDRAVAEAIRRELLREGQVFYVHNRVQDIERVAASLNELVPEARIAVAHGQMDEGSLEQVVYDFWEHRYDVLVCTTIIESGIDMPTVNTLVVDRADRLGLGQLHQLRGRVGRSGQRAYAYLFYPPDVSLSEQAYERLKTIGENTALGSGFKIAMRDLEIRGAGNLLGGDQSGHIAAVGYDLYVSMVSEAVAELKGEPIRQPAEIKLELPLDANLPPTYIAREDLRLEAYRRLATVQSRDEVEDIRTEWLDRYGPVPPEAEALLQVALLRAECVRLGIREVVVAKDVARIAPLELRASESVRLKRTHPKAVVKEDLKQLVVPLPKPSQFRFTSGPAASKREEPQGVAEFLIGFLQETAPRPAGPLASSAS